MKNISPIHIVYCYRQPRNLFSIERVFESVSSHLHENISYENLFVPCHGTGWREILRNLKRCRNVECSLFHVTGDVHYCVLASRQPAVLTIHDLGGILNDPNPLKRFFKKLWWIRLPVRAAKAVTCISEATRRELLAVCRIDPAKVHVIHNPVDDMFCWSDRAFREECPRLLHFAKFANKNSVRLARALAGIRCHLRIVGRISDEFRLALEENGIDYSHSWKLSNKEIIAEYRDCDMVCFPSLYEGFGMPIIEAQASGRVVLTSNRPPMNDIAGNGAWLVEPEDVLSIRNGIQTLLEDGELRNRLLKIGRENVKRFSTGTIAAEYEKLYRKVLYNTASLPSINGGHDDCT